MDALAFRLWRQHLSERTHDAREAAVVGLQDTPPGTAAVALAARADVEPSALEELVIVPSVRGAPLAVAPDDLALFTSGLQPPDEAAARAVTGNAFKELGDVTALDALDRVSDAVADALADGPLGRDDFHQALRERLPSGMLRWCKGCGSHHVHPSLWRATGIRGVLAIVGREGRSAVFGAPPAIAAVDDPGAALARRFLSAYGPATPRQFADWAGLAPSHATALWDRAGELAEVGSGRWLLAEDADVEPPAARGVRLLANLDPLLAARDREVAVPDEVVRKRVFKAIGGPGVVLVDGEVAGLWRPAKKGKRLIVRVEVLKNSITKRTESAMADEAERLAPFRGATTGDVEYGDI